MALNAVETVGDVGVELGEGVPRHGMDAPPAASTHDAAQDQTRRRAARSGGRLLKGT